MALKDELNSFIQTYKKGGEIPSFQKGGSNFGPQAWDKVEKRYDDLDKREGFLKSFLTVGKDFFDNTVGQMAPGSKYDPNKAGPLHVLNGLTKITGHDSRPSQIPLKQNKNTLRIGDTIGESNLYFLINELYKGEGLSDEQAIIRFSNDYNVKDINVNKAVEKVIDKVRAKSEGNVKEVKSNPKNVSAPVKHIIDYSEPTKGVNDAIFSKEGMEDFNKRATPERDADIQNKISGLLSDFNRIEQAEKITGKPANIKYDGKLPNPNEQVELEELRRRLNEENKARLNNKTTPSPVDSSIDGYMQEGGMTASEFLEYLQNHKNEPEYGYKDFDASKSSILNWAKELEYETDGIRLDTQDDLDNFAGVLQKHLIGKNKNLVNHYTTKKPFTKEDIERAIKLKLADKKWFEERGVKFSKDGTVLRGTLESGMKLDDALKMSEEFGTILDKEENKEAKENFVGAFNDNKWYYRRPQVKTVVFNNDEEKNSFVKDYEDIGDGTYYSKKTGLYFKPKVGEKKAEDITPEEVASTEVDTKETTLTTPEKSKNTPYRMPILEPDQRMPLESGVDVGFLGRVEAPNFRKINVSTEPNLSANFSAGIDALKALQGSNGMVGNAMVANILGQTQQANNQAIAQVGAQNQNIDTQIERVNEQAVATADQMNQELSTNYNNQWLQGDANLDMINRSLNKFNNEVAIQSYTNQKMRRYIEDTMGVRVGDGMSMSPNMQSNYADTFKLAQTANSLGMGQPTAKPSKKQRGGYIKEYLQNYFNK